MPIPVPRRRPFCVVDARCPVPASDERRAGPARRSARRRALGLSVAVATAVSSAAASTSDDLAAVCSVALDARFIEGAPRDRFAFVLAASEGLSLRRLEVDLAGSTGRLLFDTEAGGTGVEVFQPFRVERGEALLVDADVPADGAERIGFDFEGFIGGSTFEFSIDVDDRLPASALGQIRVSGGEIEGAALTATLVGPGREPITVSGRYTADAGASLRAVCN